MEICKKLREVKGWVKKKLKARDGKPPQPSAPASSEPEGAPSPPPDTVQAGTEAQQPPSSLFPQATPVPPVGSTVETIVVIKESPKPQSSTLDPAVSSTSTTTGNPTPLPANKSVASGLGVLEWVKSEGWTNLKGLLDTLNHATDVVGLGQVKSAVEMFASCEAAQGREEYRKLREHLEELFADLRTHITSSPVITMSIDSLCGSIKKELEGVQYEEKKRLELRALEGGVRRLQEAETDPDRIFKCYQRIQDHLERLSRNANISTWIIVDQIATENRLRDLAPSSSACYNSEKALDLKRRSCTEGTRANVLAHMHQWVITGSTGAIYWMSGMAGTGKTTIAYSLCEQLDTNPNRLLCASFFCSRSLPGCRDVGRIIPSIAYQLAQFSRPFRYALSQAIEKDPLAHTRLSQMQFESLIVHPFSDPRVKEAFPTNMVAVIDALDECDDIKSTKQILGVLLTKSKDLPIKFMVSSRPEPAIRDQMEKNGTWVDERVVLHELDSGQVRADIKTYLRAELNPITPSEAEIEQLVARAGVLFIYAATVIRYVGYDDFGRNPRARLKAILAKTGQHVKAQTKDIDELYGIVLGAAFDDSALSEQEQGDMKLILDTVICAREPLTVAALNNLLQLDDVDRVQAALRPLWSVLHVMGPNMTVTTLHASFPDYLLDSKRSGSWFCDATSHHHLLAQWCFECIQVAEPQFNICRLESSYFLDSEVEDLNERIQKFVPTELSYACQYWSSHLNAAESHAPVDLIPMLSQFLVTHLLLWMELRSLTKTMPSALGELVSAKRWATRYGTPRKMLELLNDALLFAMTFTSNSVSQSTPHIYITMLPLLPSYSPIRIHYLDRFKGLVRIQGTALDRRKDELLAEWKFNVGLGEVRSIAWAPDGSRVAIGTSTISQTLFPRLYVSDPFSGNVLLDLTQAEGYGHYSIAFSPNSSRLVAGNSDGISVWNVTNGQPVVGRFRAHDGDIRSILYSHDGSFIVSASEDKTIRMWDAISGQPVLTPLVGHTGVVTCIAITSDDARLISCSDDQTIRVWDLQSGRPVLDPIRVPGCWATAIALSPDDSRIVSGFVVGFIAIWDTNTGQLVLDPLGDLSSQVTSVSISPDGTTIASTSMVDGVRIWDATSGTLVSQLGPFSDDDGLFKRATYSPDGTRIIYGNGKETVRVLEARNINTASDPLPGHTSRITSVDISPNGRHVVSGSFDGNLCIWDMTEGGLLFGPLKGHNIRVYMVRFSPDGSRIVSCSFNDTIRQWNAQTGALHDTRITGASAGKTPCVVVAATYSPDTAHIISFTHEGEVSVWNSSNGQLVLGPITAPSVSYGVYAEFSSDGGIVIAGWADGSISAWNVQNGQMVYSRQGHARYKDLSEYSTFMVRRNLDKHIGRQVPKSLERSYVTSLAFSPDGLRYAQSLNIGKILLKNIQTEEQIPRVFEGHTDEVTCIRFSSDSTRLVSGSDDTTVHVWDVETGQSLFGQLNGHTSRVSSVAFTPDGRYVVSSSDDLAIRVWDIQPQAHSSKDLNVENADWMLNKDGWVVSGGSRRLFWVPIDLRASLMSPRNTALLSRAGSWQLDFESALIGEAWVDCWCNN